MKVRPIRSKADDVEMSKDFSEILLVLERRFGQDERRLFAKTSPDVSSYGMHLPLSWRIILVKVNIREYIAYITIPIYENGVNHSRIWAER